MSHSKVLWTIGIAMAGAMALPSTAWTQFPDHGVYLGIYGGYMDKLWEWSLGNNPPVFYTPNPLNPQSSAVMGLRLGYHFSPQLIGELGGGYLPLKSTAGVYNTALKGDIDLYYQFLRSDFSPFVGVGASAFQCLNDGDLGSDFDGSAHVTIGARGLITPKIALRVELRDYLVEDYSSFGYGQNLELTGGIDFYLGGGKKQAEPTLTAYTGSQVTYTVGSAITNNTPTYKAGIPAGTFTVSPALPGGLSIDENTGVISGTPTAVTNEATYTVTLNNSVGKAPTYALTITVNPAPAAPTLTAYMVNPAKYTVGSAITGNAPTFTSGYPATDTFTVSPKLPDGLSINAGTGEISGIPATAMSEESYKVTLKNGVGSVTYALTITVNPAPAHAPVPTAAVVAQFTRTMKGINFNLGAATILPSSFTILDQAVSTLNEYKSLRIRIEGHTDNVGASELNQKLSEARAASVKEYLVSKGVDGSRIETAGLGDTHPVQSNSTAADRAANRRIEFSILSK